MEPVFQSPFRGEQQEIREKICRLEQDYLQTPGTYAASSKESDAIALRAGQRIREGERTKDNLKIIFHWKNVGSRFYISTLEPLFDSNCPDGVAKALTSADEARADWEAVAALLGLKGVQVPTASAMLANIYPERFTVIDRLALRALDVSNPEIAFYLFYNDECRRIAERYKVTRRCLDRALWVWGKTHPPKRARIASNP
jgi:thermostable 8-oxoguanine DNA glycosylase